MICVLHVVESFDGQAAESWLARLLAFDGFDHELLHFDFFLTGSTRGKQAGSVLERGCSVQVGSRGTASIPQMARALRQHVRAGKYDIVHIHQDVLSGVFALALVGTGVQVVTHVHNCWQRLPVGGYWKERVLTTLARQLALKFSRAVVGVSGQALVKMTGGSPRNNRVDRVIYCSAKSSVLVFSEGDQKRISAEVRQQYGLPPAAQILLFLGRLDEYKNPLFALSVLRQLVTQGNQQACLVLAGVGGMADKVCNLAAQHGLTERVRLIGWTDETARLLLASNLLLMPSQEGCGEGLGLAAVEAQGFGVPVLCSLSIPEDAVLVPELFRPVSLGLGPAQWALVATQLLKGNVIDPEQCHKTLINSQFSVRASYNNIKKLYLQLTCY